MTTQFNRHDYTGALLDRNVHVVVLAGGNGERLKPLTQAIHGAAIPKQFATIVGGQSLLQMTLDRLLAFAEPDRILVVGREEHADLAEPQLMRYPGIRLLLQPEDRGTAVGIMAALARIRNESPDSGVVVLPSDHHVTQPEIYLHAITDMVLAARESGRVALLGAWPETPETDYGWLVPGRTIKTRGNFEFQELISFIEKPPAEMAQWLMNRGALWNTFVLASNAEILWQRIWERSPRLSDMFELVMQEGYENPEQELETVRSIYRRTPFVDFSRDVVAHMFDLAMLTLPPCGWTDWGRPERVFASLAGQVPLRINGDNVRPSTHGYR